MTTLTSANCIIMLVVPGIFPVPQQLQQFGPDDVFTIEPISQVEVVMGVDGTLSGGWTPAPKKQTITLAANSPSTLIFDAWHAGQSAAREVYTAQGFITIPSISRIYTCTNGFLTTVSPAPDARKILQPRKFGITWNTVLSVPL
jgi:hypothetical protein